MASLHAYHGPMALTSTTLTMPVNFFLGGSKFNTIISVDIDVEVYKDTVTTTKTTIICLSLSESDRQFFPVTRQPDRLTRVRVLNSEFWALGSGQFGASSPGVVHLLSSCCYIQGSFTSPSPSLSSHVSDQ